MKTTKELQVKNTYQQKVKITEDYRKSTDIKALYKELYKPLQRSLYR